METKRPPESSLLVDHLIDTRNGLLGVHSLDHFSMTVPNLEAARHFYTTFGLDVREVASRLDLFTTGSTHRWASLHEGLSKKLSHLSFGVFAEDLPRFAQRLTELRIERLPTPPGAQEGGLWFRDCNDLLIELKVGEVASGFMPPLPHDDLVPGARTAPFRGEAQAVRPLRLAHVMIFVRDVYESIDFYNKVLGLRLSDEVDGHVAFMHGMHGSDHHILALLRSDGPGLHHCSWDVGSFDQVGQGAMQMADHGFKAGWGLGRFVLGSNYFHYVRDPWGSYSEYVSDIDYIPAEMNWDSQTHNPQRAFYLWGPEPPRDFAVNHEIEQS